MFNGKDEIDLKSRKWDYFSFTKKIWNQTTLVAQYVLIHSKELSHTSHLLENRTTLVAQCVLIHSKEPDRTSHLIENQTGRTVCFAFTKNNVSLTVEFSMIENWHE